MNDVIEYLIDHKLKNGNDGQGRHWSGSHKERIAWANAIWIPHGWRVPSEIEWVGKVDIEVVRCLGKGERLWDPDSVLRGNAKQLIDEAVARNILVDDSAKYVRMVAGLQDDTHRSQGPRTILRFKGDLK